MSSRLSTEDVVERAKRLPEVLVRESDSYSSITFKGKGFAWVNHPENRALIKSTHDERAAMLATSPDVYEEGWASPTTAWVLVHLEVADPDEVDELIEEAWRMTATKKVVRAFDELQGRSGPG